MSHPSYSPYFDNPCNVCLDIGEFWIVYIISLQWPSPVSRHFPRNIFRKCAIRPDKSLSRQSVYWSIFDLVITLYGKVEPTCRIVCFVKAITSLLGSAQPPTSCLGCGNFLRRRCDVLCVINFRWYSFSSCLIVHFSCNTSVTLPDVAILCAPNV
jgi:hypothetical protein